MVAAFRGKGATIAQLVPHGHSLLPDTLRRRHRGVLILLAAHAVGLTAFGFLVGARPWHAILEGTLIALIAGIAALPQLGQRTQSIVASFGLMSCSAVLTHLSGGYIEAHFHFFVMLGVIFLYEDWLPYVLSVVYVAVHHGIAGTLDPLSVYNHPSAISAPWTWAGVHALFILGLSAVLVVAWNVIHRARRSETAALREAHELRRQLHGQEKMAALGSLVAGLAHEVRTPLTVVSTNASLIEMRSRKVADGALSDVLRAHTREIQQSVERMNGLVRQLRRFHGLPPDETVVTTLDAVVREAVSFYGSVNRAARPLTLDLAPTPAARLHPLGIHQVVLNLVTNAVEAVDPARGTISVRTREENGRAVLIIEDDGCGMAEDVRAKAFDPLFTTKKEGMGLGLDIVARIVEAHGGEISLVSAPGKGTTFTVRFPFAVPGVDVPVTSADASARAYPSNSA